MSIAHNWYGKGRKWPTVGGPAAHKGGHQQCWGWGGCEESYALFDRVSNALQSRDNLYLKTQRHVHAFEMFEKLLSCRHQLCLSCSFVLCKQPDGGFQLSCAVTVCLNQHWALVHSTVSQRHAPPSAIRLYNEPNGWLCVQVCAH